MVYNELMVRDTENKKRELSTETRALIERFERGLEEKEASEGAVNTIYVDSIASKIAEFYEKLRMIIDWKDEHLIRRTAIERSLKRRFLSELGNGSAGNYNFRDVSESLLMELIRAGHFPNNSLPRERIGEVAKVLEKYSFILENAAVEKQDSQGAKERVNFYHWLLEVAACEIEGTLEPAIKENALIDYMTVQLLERLKLDPSIKLSPEEKETHLYIAVHRALFRLDSPIIAYHLLQCWYENWDSLEEANLNAVTQNITRDWRNIEKLFDHPLYPEFYKFCERYDTYYLLLGDIFSELEKQEEEEAGEEKVENTISKPSLLERLTRMVYEERAESLSSRLTRTATYSTLSIFVGGAVSLFLVEVPLARLFAGRFSPTALAVDLAVPTAVMYLLVGTARPPEEENLEKVIEGMKRTVYEGFDWGLYEITPKKKRSFWVSFLVTLLYFFIWVVSLSAVAAAFYFARVPLPSVVLDTINVAVVTFAGIEIRQRANELRVGETRTKISDFIFDTFSLPVAKLGKWLSEKWKEYNLVSVFFTALIDMPFLGFIQLIESWSAFLKEKKSGMYS